MGLSSKSLRKARGKDLDLEDFDDSEDDELMVNEEEEEDHEDDEVEDGKEDEFEEDNDDEEEEGSEEEDNDGEMEELEKEYKDLHNQEQDVLKNLKRHKDEDVQKGQAVKNQKALWDKTLEFRFLLQKAFSNSNRLPQDPVRFSFCASDEVVNVAYSELITASKKTLDSILELHEALLEKNPSISESSVDGNAGPSSKKLFGDSKNSDMEDDEEWLWISQMNRRIVAFRDKAVDKWQRKTEVTTGAAAIRSKLQAFNQNISEQVAAYMRDPSRMIKQMQQRRSTIGIFGAVTEGTNNANGVVIFFTSFTLVLNK
ncbi:hypothetical protein CRYUN_Cryun18bG0107400 [Craigia yunnanensis]